jgi:hypothetical protein
MDLHPQEIVSIGIDLGKLKNISLTWMVRPFGHDFPY